MHHIVRHDARPRLDAIDQSSLDRSSKSSRVQAHANRRSAESRGFARQRFPTTFRQKLVWIDEKALQAGLTFQSDTYLKTTVKDPAHAFGDGQRFAPSETR